MPLGVNPGIYTDIIPVVYTEPSAGGATAGLFFVFSRKGEDNVIRTADSPTTVIRNYGNPDLAKYGQGLYNAYNHSRVSSNTLVHRTLPNLEDTPTSTPLSNTYIQMPATFANVHFALLNSGDPVADKLLVPVSFIPPQFIQKPEYARAVYQYETEAPSLEDTSGHILGVTRSTSVYIDYKGEYTNVTTAGLFLSNLNVPLTYPGVRQAIYDLGLYNSTDPYIQAFLANGPTTTLTVAPGSVYNAGTPNYLQLTGLTGASINLTGTLAENAPQLLVYVNGTYVPPTDYTWASPTLTFNTITLTATDVVEIVAVFLANTAQVAYNTTLTLPAGATYLVVDSNGNVDWNQTKYQVTYDTSTTPPTPKITSLDTGGITVYYDTNFGAQQTYLQDIYTNLVTYDSSGNANFTLTINPDIVAQTLGYSIAVFVDGIPVNFTWSSNQVQLTLTGTPGSSSVVVVQYVQVNDPNATVDSVLTHGIYGKGRGGWYNKLAFQIVPQFEETSSQFIPNAKKYLLQVLRYEPQVGDYVPTDDIFTFDVRYNGTDDYGRPADLETLVNTFGNDIFVFQNDVVLDQLQNTPPIDNRYESRWEELFHKMYSYIAGQNIRLKGGAEGCVRQLDGFLYWPIGTSILVKAIQGVYDNNLYDTDNLLIDVVFDADYPDAVKMELVNLCELRQDCVAILDVPKYPNVDSVVAWYDSFGLSSMFAAIYTPHMKIYSQFDNDYVWLAPSYVLSFMVPFVDKTYGFYEPIAGKKRGNVRFDIQKYAINISLTENSSDLQKLVLRNINPIGRKQGLNVIWGNSTTYRIPSAVQSLHATRITVRIHRDLKFALSAVQWDLMRPALETQIKNIVLGVLANYIGTAIGQDVNVSVQFNPYDVQQRLARVYVDFRPYLELRRIYLQLTVR